jgi:serine/alanine adding enzyme
MLDIYFAFEYGKLYEKIENGSSEIFNFSSSYGEISYMFIKRKINLRLSNLDYYDIVTPYGYGGPVILNCTHKEKLLSDYKEQFSKYCNENSIISEFVRFHPLINNQVDFHEVLEVFFNRQTVAVNLKVDDVFMTELSSKCRNTIRKAKKIGVRTSIDTKGDTIETFHKLYVDTMERNVALDYYYFPLEYLMQLKNTLKSNFIIVNSHFNDEIIASALFLYSEKYIHYHLAATNPKYYSLAPNNAILWEAISWGKDNNLLKMHLGGGLTSFEDDNLYKFKKSFSNEKNCDFYVGRKIHNQEIYRSLVTIRKLENDYDENTSYFPAYRG